MRTLSLLNRKAIRREFLNQSMSRYHKFTQVSKHTMDLLESQVKLMIVRIVQEAPSKGKRL